MKHIMDTVQENKTEMGANIDLCNVDAYEDPVTHQVVKAKPCNGDHHPQRCQGGRENWPKGTTTKIQVYFLSMMALFMVALPADAAYLDDHPVQEVAVYPAAHPVKTGKGFLFALRHPTAALQNIGKKCQDVGEWYETKRGVKGCGNLILAGTGIGTNVLLGAKSFR